MGATKTRMTVDDYYAVTVEGDRTQLVDGAIVVNEPKLPHAVLQGRLLGALIGWTNAGGGRGLALPPIDVVLGEFDLYAPDLVWIAEAHRPGPGAVDLERVPDLCVEIRSPSTWRYDIGTKKRVYESAGLPELWLVDDVAQTVFVFRRSHPDAATFDVELELRLGDRLESPQLPGFALELERLFAR